MMAVQVLLLGAGLEPDAVFGVWRKEIERCHVQTKLLSLGELAETCAETDQFLAWKVGGLFHQVLLAVVDAITM